MKSIFTALTFIAAVAVAETTTYTIEGMHCAGCKSMVEKSVCENPEITKNAESCAVNLTDTKKQMGEVVIVAKKDMKIDSAVVKDSVKVAGEDYKITNEAAKETVIAQAVVIEKAVVKKKKMAKALKNTKKETK